MGNIKPYKKAWHAPTDQFTEPWFSPELVVYADSRGKAKPLLFKSDYDELIFNKDRHQIDFYGGFYDFVKRIRVVRCRESDKFLIDGNEITRSELEYMRKKKEKEDGFDKLLKENQNSFSHIVKNGSYYADNWCGYVSKKIDAGIYTTKEAVSHCKGMSLNDNFMVELIDIEEHNNIINSKIDNLKLRIISKPE